MGVGRTDRRPPATASALARLAPDCRLGTLVQLSGDDDRVWFCPLAHRCRCSLVGQRHIFIRTIYMHIHSLAYTRVLVGARAPSQSTYVCIRCIFLAAAHPVTSSVATVGSISSRHELISTGTRPPRDKSSIHRPSTQHSFPLWLLRELLLLRFPRSLATLDLWHVFPRLDSPPPARLAPHATDNGSSQRVLHAITDASRTA